MTSSTTDYEQLTYDEASNVTNVRLRSGHNIAMTFDNLNRLRTRTPTSEQQVVLTYNLLGQQTLLDKGTTDVSMAYDARAQTFSQDRTSAPRPIPAHRAQATEQLDPGLRRDDEGNWLSAPLRETFLPRSKSGEPVHGVQWATRQFHRDSTPIPHLFHTYYSPLHTYCTAIVSSVQ